MIKKLIKQDQNTAIFQHNAITEARYDMSSLQKNIFYLLLIQLKDGDPLDKKYKISISDINSRSIGGKKVRVTRAEFYLAATSLMERCLTLYDQDQKEFITLGIVNSATYGAKDDNEDMVIEIDPKLYPFLYNVKNRFTTFTLKNALNLKSKYAKRIYEQLCQFKSTGIFRISVQELKERFKLIDPKTGIEKYHTFGEFARNVLEVAEMEINEHTDINFEYTTKKTGRKITDLEFKIRSKEVVKALAKSNLVDPQVEELTERLVTKFQLSKTLAKKIVEEIPTQEINKILHAIQLEHGDHKIRKVGAYATTVFQNRLDGVSPIAQKSNTLKYVSPQPARQEPIEVAVSSEEKKEEEENTTSYSDSMATGRLGSTVSIGEQLAQVMISSRPVQTQNNLLSEEDLMKYEEEKKQKAEEKKQQEEEYKVWKKLYNDFRIDYLEVDVLVKEHSLEDLKAAVVKVSEEMTDQEIPLESSHMVQMLKKHLNLD